jgi:bifunctional DNA-binding transcriptional regulator/antitoxin component of YhaV-PrlF toxin-antitoxin module
MEIIHKVTSKGQVTIPQDIRAQAGMPANSEVAFELRRLASGQSEVVIRPVAKPVSALRAALQQVRGSANAAEFKGMSTDEFMRFLRA